MILSKIQLGHNATKIASHRGSNDTSSMQPSDPILLETVY